MKEAAITTATDAARKARPAGASAGLAVRLRPRLVPLALTALAAVGLGISIYLTAAHYGDKPIVCAGVGQCDYVNSSEYASVLGIPVSVLGVLMYAGLLAVAAAWLVRYRSEVLPVAYWGMALAGAGYAGYLTYVELDILHAICVWCVASATILTASFLLSTAVLLKSD